MKPQNTLLLAILLNASVICVLLVVSGFFSLLGYDEIVQPLGPLVLTFSVIGVVLIVIHLFSKK